MLEFRYKTFVITSYSIHYTKLYEAIVKITACVAEINFNGEEVTAVELDLVRSLTDEESAIQTALAYEMFFGEAK